MQGRILEYPLEIKKSRVGPHVDGGSGNDYSQYSRNGERRLCVIHTSDNLPIHR